MTIPSGTVFGRYEIRSKIGAGGMGEVYKAEDLMLRRPIAIKFIKKHGHDSAEAEKRFLREARTASQLNHPNIVTIHEICETNELTYIVMEYVEGRNLRSLIAARALNAEAALDAAVQIADALAEAHAHGIVHRDIKPENIIVNERGQAKLLDFGLARAFERSPVFSGEALTMVDTDAENLTGSGVVVGTVPYMSPEQIRKDEPLDSRTDIFSFGIVLYEMLTGRHPFRGGNIFEVGAAILSNEAVAIENFDATLPTEAGQLLARLLEKERRQRIASFSEVKVKLVALKLQLAQRGGIESNNVPTLQLAHSRDARKERSAPAPSASRSWHAWSRAAGVPPTVLVLPLEGVGGADESSYIGVGLASVITTDLAKINNLSVLSKSAGAGRANKTGTGARELARELGANILLEGEVMCAGQSVRITARLIDVESGRVIWGEQYRGDESDLFNIQDQVCASVAGALKLNVSQEVRDQMAQPATTDINAFELYSRGRAYLERHDLEENLDYAIQMFVEALNVESKFALAFAGLAEAYWRKYQYTHVHDWVPRAIAAGDRALVLDPRQAQVRISLGMVYHGTGKTERAIEEFQQAIDLQPMSDDAYSWLGRCYMQKGELEQALNYLNKAIELRPGYWGNYNRLGICYYNFGQYANAIEQFRRVITFQPDNNQGYNNLGGIYCLLGRYEDAVAMHQRAIEISPSATAYSGLGTNYYYLGRYEEAIEAYEAAVRLAPRNDLYYRNLGDAYLRVGRGLEASAQYELASRELTEQLAVNPQDAHLLGRLAICQAKLTRRQEAFATMERASELAPHDTTLMYQSAVVCALTGHVEKAIEFLGRALRHGYSRPEAECDPDLDVLRSRAEYAALFNSPGSTAGV